MSTTVSSSQAQDSKSRRPEPYVLLDAFRGIACLLVLLYHIAEMAVRRDPSLATNAFFAVCSHGHLGVQIFFVVSGYCIGGAAVGAMHARGDESPLHRLWNYTKARARRIFPPYWAAVLYMLLYWGAVLFSLGRGGQNASVTIDDNPMSQGLRYWFSNVLLGNGWTHDILLLPVAWTLCYEVAFYGILALCMVLTFALQRAERLRSSVDPLVWAHLVTTVTLTVQVLWKSGIGFPLDLWPQFGFGALVFDYLNGNRGRATVFGAVSALLAGILIWLHGTEASYFGQIYGPMTILALLFSLLLLLLHRQDRALSTQPGVGALSFVGTISYSLYLTHMQTIRLAGQALRMIGFRFLNSPLVFVFITSSAAMLVAYLFFWRIENRFIGQKRSVPGTGEAPANASREGIRPPDIQLSEVAELK